MDCSVIVATFGDTKWRDLATHRAVPSAIAQEPAAVITSHGSTLAGARNAGAAQAASEWLCFLDADDELEPGYLEALDQVDGDLRAPSVRYVVDAIPGEPVSLADRDITRLNPCVIGTLIRRELFLNVGGFWTERAWEDWSLFRRAWLAGAELVHVPPAIYRAYVSLGGRNVVSQPRVLHRQIIASHDRWKKER